MPIDWTKNSEEAAREVVRETEAFLGAQLTLAVAADQRSSSMASIFTAAGAGLIVGLIALASTNDARDPSALGIYLGGGFASLLFLVAAIRCVYAALPVGFQVPGNVAESWKADIENGRSLRCALGEQAENYDGKIAANDKVLKHNAALFKSGAIIAVWAPVAGAAIWLAVLLCQHAH